MRGFSFRAQLLLRIGEGSLRMTAEGAPRAPDGIGWPQWRVIILSSLGGALEFYDFVIYSMFAQYIGAAFFPAADPLNSLLLSFTVFAVGYIARPVGGVVFSHFGDKYGRRPVFIVAMLTMSLATTAIGLLPTYAQWGIGASACMVLLRLLQGFSLGGELPGAITYVVETAPRRAGFVAGFVFFCVNSGVALASGLNLTVHKLMAEPDIAAWGWRIARQRHDGRGGRGPVPHAYPLQWRRGVVQSGVLDFQRHRAAGRGRAGEGSRLAHRARVLHVCLWCDHVHRQPVPAPL
jgi:hypothetical protein